MQHSVNNQIKSILNHIHQRTADTIIHAGENNTDFNALNSDLFADLCELWSIESDFIGTEFDVDSGEIDVKASSGKGGALFVWSRTRKLMLKSISDAEWVVLREFIPHFHYHVKTHPSSLLMRILGAWKIENRRFIMLVNALNADNYERDLNHLKIELLHTFDLKGSKINRESRVHPADRTPSTPLLDLDFEAWCSQNTLSVGMTSRRNIMHALRSDCRLLSRFGLMDYSVLLGVWRLHRLRHGMQDKMASFGLYRTHQTLPDGGVMLLSFTLIDFLQPYNAKKRAANLFKSALHDEYLLSTIAPQPYATRLFEYMATIL